MGEQETYEAGWYQDPRGRFELRYYDGTTWTDHVSTGGNQSSDPFGTDEKMTTGLADYLIKGESAEKFTSNRARWEGTGHLFTEPVLLVRQDAKLIATSSDFQITKPDGTPLGSVRQVGQSAAKQLVRAFTKLDRHMTHRFELVDAEGQVMLRLVRPATLVKSKVTVEDGAGNEIGKVVQRNSFGKIRFELEAGGATIGRIQGKNWRDYQFTIFDAADEEVGRITKSFEGIAKAMFTSADNFVVAMHRPLEDPLRQMVIASGVCIDTALHHEDGGIL